MIVNKYENIVSVDVDETLIMHDHEKYPQLPKVHLNYYGHDKICAVHTEHVILIKAYQKRGFWVRVNSNNGWKWAEKVVDALDLRDFVNEVCTKTSKYMDDHKDAAQVCGQHVYIPIIEGVTVK